MDNNVEQILNSLNITCWGKSTKEIDLERKRTHDLIERLCEEIKIMKDSLDFARTSNNEIMRLGNENLKLKHEIEMLTNELDKVYQGE